MTTKPTYPPQTDPNQLTFKVSVSNITPTTAEITVSPSNETKSYFSDIVTDADWLESQKHGFDDYLQYFIEVVMMEQQEMTREEAVKAITSYGNDAYTARGLEPGAKYWAVAVGIDATDTRRRSLPQKLLQRRLHPNPPIHSKSQRQQSHRQEHRLPLHRRTAMFTSWMFCRLTSSPRCRRVRIIKNI